MRILLIAYLMLVSQVALPAVYYVATDGNNSNPGSLLKPFRTIRFAISRIRSGDILYIRSGIYNERFTVFGKSGNQNYPTIISAYPGETPAIDGAGIVNGAGSGLIYISDNYITIKGIEIRNSDQAGIISEGTHNIISNCIIHDCMQDGIGLDGDFNIAENITAFNTCMINENGKNRDWGTGISARRSPKYCIIRNCRVYECWGEAISTFEANHTTIENNIVYDFYSVGIYVSDATDCLVQGNLVYTTRDMADGSQVGIGHWNERFSPANESNVFVNNIVAGCYRNFYHGDTMKGLIVANNTFYNSTLSEGVMISNRNQVSGEIRNNIILQENSLPCITIENNNNIILSNNLYNKTYSPKASGIGDIVSNPLLKKTGDTAPGRLSPDFFALMNGSPAIDAGYSLPQVLADINGFKRDGKPDIGAIEFNSSSSFVKVSSIAITTSYNLSNLKVGDTLELSAEISPADATVKSVTWSLIGNPQAASISSAGLFRAISHGMVTVLALANDGSGVSASIDIFIYPDDSDGLQMQISPVPATDVINISLNKNYNLPLAVRISDLYGRIIIKYQVHENNFNIMLPAAISAGLYFVQLCSDNGILETRKLIIVGT